MLKKRNTFYSLAVLTVLLFMTMPLFSNGLLIVAHGSPDSKWNQSVLNLREKISGELTGKKNSPYKGVALSFLETTPSIKEGITELEGKGATKIYVLPLFMAPSEHLNGDIPAVLGLYEDAGIRKQLKKEKIAVVNSSSRITVGPPLMYGDVLKKAMYARVKELSANKNNEAIVILSHGSEMYEPLWKGMVEEIKEYLSDKSGIRYCDYAFIEAGQSFSSKGIPAIEKAFANKERVLVLSLFLGSGTERMMNYTAKKDPERCRELVKKMGDKKLVFSNGLLPGNEDYLVSWIIDRAKEYSGIKQQ